MQREHKEAGRPSAGADIVTCPSCRAELVAGLRFCRMCGYRLGEGVEEFNETRRFDGRQPPFAPTAAKDAPPFAHANVWTAAPLAPVAPHTPAGGWQWAKLYKPWLMGWAGWVVLSLAIMFAVGMVVKQNRRQRPGGAPVAQKSFLGVDGLETAEGGGAFIEGIAAPDTPVVRAGLIGGDVIKSFDGKPVADAGVMRRLLAATPVGMAVEVVYVRDGETRTTTLTTGSERDSRGSDAFDRRPGGEGYLGLSSLKRVRVPNTNIYGVEINDVQANRPADLAGLKEGDIVFEFNGQPVRTAGDLRYRIQEAVPGETVKAVVSRAGQVVEIMVKMGRSD